MSMKFLTSGVATAAAGINIVAAPFCVMAWYNYAGALAATKCLVAESNGTTHDYMLLHNSVAAVTWLIRQSNGTAKSITSAAISTGSWYHIAGIYSNVDNKLYLYINGASAAVAVAADGTLADGGYVLSIGNDSGGTPARPVYNQIADVRIYNRVPSAAELTNIVNMKGNDGIVNGLIRRYTLLNGEYGTLATTAGLIKDLASTHANLTINDATKSSYLADVLRCGRPIGG